jgi:hypothetical protein
VRTRSWWRLPGTPPPAEIWFGGRFGARRIGLESDDEGHYRATLPEGGDWWVDLTSREEDVRRSLLVEVVPDSDGTAVVDLHVPDTELYGLVVDAADDPVPSADLSLGDALGGSTSAATDSEGQFRIRGLPEGDVSLVATRGGPGSASTPEVTVPIQEGAPTGPVVLRLVESRPVAGIVLLDGAPVPGAQVKAFPESGGLGATARTDVLGRFSFELRADAEFFHVEVAPPAEG